MPPKKATNSINRNKHHLLHQARMVVCRVYDFMKKEALEKYAEKLTDARWRTSQAVGVSEMTVSKILKERRQGMYPQANAAGNYELVYVPDSAATVKREPDSQSETERSVDAAPSATEIKIEIDCVDPTSAIKSEAVHCAEDTEHLYDSTECPPSLLVETSKLMSSDSENEDL